MSLSNLIAKNAELTSAPSFQGSWFKIQWMPDLATGELLNVGIALIGSDGRMHVKTLKSYARLECLYDQEIADSAAFVLELVKSALLSGSAEPPSRNISYSEQLFVQGASVTEVLNELFETTVTLARPKKESLPEIINEPRMIKTAELREVVFHQIKESVGVFKAAEILPQNTMLTKRVGDRVYNLDVPIQGKKHLGTVVSAVYKSVQHVELNLLRAFSDIETAIRAFDREDQGGLFILRPDDDVMECIQRNSRREIERKLDQVAWKAENSGIRTVIKDDPSYLAQDVLEWAC